MRQHVAAPERSASTEPLLPAVDSRQDRAVETDLERTTEQAALIAATDYDHLAGLVDDCDAKAPAGLPLDLLYT
jgi:hypothetical protein